MILPEDLPIDSKQVTLVYYGDLEDYIYSIYNKKTDMARYWEANQETIRDLEIDSDPRCLEYWDQSISNEQYETNAQEVLDEWLNYEKKSRWDEPTIDPQVVMWDLCRKGLFPKGEIKVHVWW